MLCSMLLALLSSCAETIRCPDGHVFNDRDECIPIADAGSERDD